MNKKYLTLTDVENFIKNETGLLDFYQRLQDEFLLTCHDTLSDDFQILSAMQFAVWKFIEKRLQIENDEPI